MKRGDFDFDPAYIDTDFHNRVADSIKDGFVSFLENHNHVVKDRNGSVLTTFGCVEWGSEVYRGIMWAR